jgi:hypothetical protein
MAAVRKGDSKGAPVISAEDVRRLAGPLDDETVAEILKLGASLEELEIAASYAEGEGDRLDRLGHTLTGKVAEIYEILSADQEEAEFPPR